MSNQGHSKNEILETIHHLRTIHGQFSDREISGDNLNTILTASIRAANSSARQCYSIVVVKDRDKMKKVCGFAGSRTLVFCADYNRLIDVANHMNMDFHASGIVPFVTAGMDAMLAAQTAAIAAKSLGIDSLFTNGLHRGDLSRVYQLLDLPDKYCFPMTALVLGYPDNEPKERKGRYDGPGLIHYNTYQRATNEELNHLIDFYDNPENNMWLNDDWLKKGYKHYFSWFFSNWSLRASIGKEKKARSQMTEILESSCFLDS